ncbi:MAG: TonB-dependent receptor [Chitinophagaceae bacterium]
MKKCCLFLSETILSIPRILFLLVFFLGLSLTAMAQQSVTGNVVSEDGHGVPATIHIKGGKNMTVADSTGHFTIYADKGATLVVDYVGYNSVEKIIENPQESLTITMTSSVASKLTDVVVVGYGTQKKSDVTGSVISVPKSRLSQLPVTNVLSAVEGAVAGVNVTTTSSVPGSTPSVLVRGQNSINATTSPYIVVDGIPLSKSGGSINDINPNDIASMEVLKDASAVAIYGVNGSNGVILITTKRGTSGKPTIRYNSYAGLENIAHILKPSSGEQYVQKYADYMTQSGQTQTSPVPNSGELAYYNAGKTTDWVDEATQQGVMQDHNLNISGGNQDVRYYISGEYMKQQGVVLGYQYRRISFRSNLDINVTSYLTMGTSLFISNNNYDGGHANLLFATAMSPYAPAKDSLGDYVIYPMYPELLYTNPLLGLTTQNESRNTNLNGNAYAEVRFGGVLKGLKYRMNFGYTYLPARTAYYGGRAANDLYGTASMYNAETNTYTMENLLYYNRDWKKHHIDFTGLYSAQQRRFISNTSGSVSFINDALSFYNMSAGQTQTAASYADQYRLNSQMVRVNYSYDSRYLLTVTARRDGSSVFGSNTSKHDVFPSVAVGWNISKEHFLENSDVVNNLKLRASYGKSGNEAISVYSTKTTLSSVAYPFEGVSTVGLIAGNLGNNDLKWEHTTGLNLGTDFGLFDNRVSGSIDVYHTQTKDMLLQRSLPTITGYSSIYDNLGKLDNKGIDINITTKNVVAGDFSWESTLNFSANKNKILDLYGDKKSDVGNTWFIGHPVNVLYDYVKQGIWQEGEDYSTQDPAAAAGYIKFADINGDGEISADSDRVIIGQTAPKWTGGITNTFHYKNFHLNIFIQTAQGMMKNNPDLSYGDEIGRRNTPADLGYWTPENKSNFWPSLVYYNTRGYGYPSKASYTRLKDITFSYVFSQKLLDALRLNSCTVYISGRNLYTWTSWFGWDPENNYSTRGSGDWTNNYPLTRSFVLGLNISLK